MTLRIRIGMYAKLTPTWGMIKSSSDIPIAKRILQNIDRKDVAVDWDRLIIKSK